MIKPGRIIVIGGNAAGPAAAAQAKRTNPDAQVVLIEKNDFISTGTCEMPYVLGGKIDSAEQLIFFNPDSFLKSKGVEVLINTIVDSINVKNSSVSIHCLASGEKRELKYDSLILATGSRAICPFEFNRKPVNIFTLKTIADLRQITSYIKNNTVRKSAIFGSGLTGLEVAEALRSKNMETLVFENANNILPSADSEISALVKEILIMNGCEVFTNTKKATPIINGDKIIKIKIGSRLLDVDMVIVATGVVPESTLAKSIGVRFGHSGGILVNSKFQTSMPRIFAAGDVVEYKEFVTGQPRLMPLASLAYKSGHIAGENAAGGNKSAPPFLGVISIKLFNSYYSKVGLNEKEAKIAGLQFQSAATVLPNRVKVMPESKSVYAKLIFESKSGRLLGGVFLGGNEVSGYADIISLMIKNKIPVHHLAEADFNYTPPLSPFINPLNVLGIKIKKLLNQ